MLAKASIFTWSRRFLDTRALPSQKTCMGISSKVRSAQLPLECPRLCWRPNGSHNGSQNPPAPGADAG
jgi:hypothetical protein